MKDKLIELCLLAVKYMNEHNDYSLFDFLPSDEVKRIKNKTLEEQATLIANNVISWVEIERMKKRLEQINKEIKRVN